MTIRKITILILLLVSIYSCKNPESDSIKPMPTGAPGDVLIVMNESLWDTPAGDTLLQVLTTPYEALPKEEPMFNVIHVTHKAFGKNIKQQRNIIVTKVGKDQPDAKILIKKDLWAKTQILISILAPDREKFITLVDANREKIISVLNEAERQRLMDVNRGTRDDKITSNISKKFHIKLHIPKGYKTDVNDKDFMWLSHEYRDIIQGVFIYTYDYTDKNTFTRDYLVEKRNAVLKRNVPGEIEGSYMTTEPLFPPIMKEVSMNGKYTTELQGLWRMQDGYAMGGPFISLVQLDEKRNKIITVDGFVFAPAHKKRELVRQLEAVLYSIEILD
jgi:hypothetical protein